MIFLVFFSVVEGVMGFTCGDCYLLVRITRRSRCCLQGLIVI